ARVGFGVPPDGGVECDDGQTGGSVVGEGVPKASPLGDRQHETAGAGRNERNGAARIPEVRKVVVVEVVAVHADVVPADLGQGGQLEDQEAGGVVVRVVRGDVCVGRVLDLDARDVVGQAVFADYEAVRLADVDAGVAGAIDGAVLDQHLLGLHGVDSVAAVGGAVRPGNADVVDVQAARPGDLEAIARGVLDAEILEGDLHG